MKNGNHPFLLVIIPLVLLAFNFTYPTINNVGNSLAKEEKGFLSPQLPNGYNTLFAGSGECTLCHSSQVNNAGESVSIVNDWRSSMMANASKDPFWKAKVSHEALVNPQHAEALEDVCTRCHAPVGHFNAHYTGQSAYSIAELETDPLALDGVSCTVCHQLKEESLGNYSGELLIGDQKIIWGPYENPFSMPMVNHTGYTPAYGQHIHDARLCGSCHTLITNTVDLNGNPTGTQFVEQAIYHEWLNSGFPDSETTCQSCHMPRIQDDVVISTMPPWLDGRSPFAMHHLAGANVFMLKLLKQNAEDLGITALEVHIDSTIARAERMLQQASVHLELQNNGRTNDSLYITAALQNMAGHKFPTGYPSRRAFISLLVKTESGDTIFHSGKMDLNFNLIQEDEAYELHHNLIVEDDQVQIYEMVMGDVNSVPTTVLERASIALKDNRIPPSGFSTGHVSYDTVQIAGNALTDPDFNLNLGVEGTGSDLVHYRIFINGSSQNMLVEARIYYQTVNDKWLEHMFSYGSEAIDLFKSQYQNADKTPIIVAEASFVSTVTTNKAKEKRNYYVAPNPANGRFRIHGISNISEFILFDAVGNQYDCNINKLSDFSGYTVNAPKNKGLFVYQAIDEIGRTYYGKIILN